MALLPRPGEPYQAPIRTLPRLSSHASSPLQLTLTFQDKDFKVTLPDRHSLTFPNRLGHNHLRYLSMDGLQISSFKLE